MDVMRDLATPLPVLVIAEMMGVPEPDRPYIRQLAEKLLYIGRGEYDRMKPLTEGMKGMIEYVSPLVDERIANPGDDFISVLASGEKQGVFTRHQVLVNTSLLLLAGHETTINLLCNGTLAFIRHPDQWAELKKDPAGAAKLATEECLRYDSPVKSIQRIALEDVEMRGKALKKNDRVRWFISSANRDPEMFEKPDTFDITRWPNQHVAFGSGIHHCLGATLARVEGQEVFKALAERFPGLRLDNEALEYQPSITFRSLKSLPIHWQEEAAMARNLRIRVDHNVCVGNAMCETFASNVFRLNDNRQSEAVDPAGDSEEKILEAAENCTVSAITVEDADTGEQLFP
jgi:cytochrome P450/ferredoxin